MARGRWGLGAWQWAGPGARRVFSRAAAGERREEMAEQWELDEEGIRRLGALTLEQPGRVWPGGCGPGT